MTAAIGCCCLLFYLWLSAAIRPAVPNWLYLAVQQPFSFTTHHHHSHHHHHQALPLSTSLVTRICHSLNYLNDQQKRMCIAHPSTMHSVSIGARQAIAECQWQFRLERWNCTPVRTPNESISDIFATTLKSGKYFCLFCHLHNDNCKEDDDDDDDCSRESAFIEAISTAGLVHSVVSACTAGNVTDCSCDLSRHGMAAFSQGNNPNDVGERWRWGGCSDNIRYGLMFAREFLDRHMRRSWQQNRDARFLVTLHNHEVGRKVISENMRRSCRCHGVSGSCEFKTCWLQMPKLTDIGERLKMYYDRSAIQVTKRPKRKLRRKNRYERKIPIRHSELVFHNRSPNYCVRDERIGTLGTHGRQCSRTSFGTDSCDLLCCGRGYDTRVVLKYERCHCKFVWCCYVTCKTCAWNVEMHTCK
ncbi:hypothetical protein M513_03811 [Trichuris suis]|uniref:Protein Wnt n=1 Tax=Trichuris suis TaxID=68888 RepID=A0A085MD74_9BILA|nr:hypothetical protein M513_03811 [Trichuris suis]